MWIEIVENAKDDFEELSGYELEIVLFEDNVLPNTALAEGTVDGTFHQHKPYLEEYNKSNDTNLVMHGDDVVLGGNYGIYSTKIQSLNEIKEGDSVAIANDPSNRTIALNILEQHGLIELSHENELLTQMDIVENPLNLEMIEVGSNAQVVTSMDDVTIIATASIAFVQGGLDASNHLGLVSDDIVKNSAIGIAIREEDQESKWGEYLKEALSNKNMESYLDEVYTEVYLRFLDKRRQIN